MLNGARFLDCEKWRKEFGGGVEHLVRTFNYTEKPQVFKYYPQYYHKTDKVCKPTSDSLLSFATVSLPITTADNPPPRHQDGRPVYIEQLGGIDLNAMYKITTGERMLQNLVVEYEKVADPRLPACSRKAGQLLETCCTIMDMKGVGLGSARQVYDYVGKASAVSQNYYPERLGKLYVINAPFGFSTVWSFVKGFLDPVTVAKVHILGTGYEKELHAQVPKENLPHRFGGTCQCEGGCEFSDPGPWKDPQYAKPAWWEKPAEGKEEAIENKGSEVGGETKGDAAVGAPGASAGAGAGATEGAGAGGTAPAKA